MKLTVQGGGGDHICLGPTISAVVEIVSFRKLGKPESHLVMLLLQR